MNLYRKIERLEKSNATISSERDELKSKNKELLKTIEELKIENEYLKKLTNAKDKKEREFEQAIYDAYKVQSCYKDLISNLKKTRNEMKKYI